MISVIDDYFDNINDNLEHLGEQTMLNEMSTLLSKRDGCGFEIMIMSNDHNPPHMHLRDGSNHKPIAKLIIKKSEPKTVEDIETVDEDNLTNGMKRDIIKALHLLDDDGLPMWRVAQVLWNHNNPDIKIR